MSELLKCPFCGGNLDYVHWGYSYNQEIGVQCSDCKILITSIDGEITKEELTEKVNARKPMERIVERLEEKLRLAEEEKDRCVIKALPYYDNVKGYATGMHNAIEIAKEEGEINR